MKGLSIIILLLIINSSFGQQFTDLYDDYLGQPPPDDTPVVFARGIVSTEDQNHGIPTFSPDGNEVFWQTNSLDNEKKWLHYVMTMQRIGNRWTVPEVSSYDRNPVSSPDGKRLYFGLKGEENDSYFIERQGNSWSEPKRVGLVLRFPELQKATQLSVTLNGTLYFLSCAKGFRQDLGIYRAEFINGVFAKPELLSPAINAPGDNLNWTPFIAPDESYLIFCSNGDLYICFRKPDGSWTERINLGEPINSKERERFPAVSSDGKYLFFTRWTSDYDEDVYWVSAKIIEKLKAKAIQEMRLK
jgi:Tol biopolymer transport system component